MAHTTRLTRLLTILFSFILFSALAPAAAQDEPPDLPPPRTVTIAGTIQPQLGCPGEWQPECSDTQLVYQPSNDLWRATFQLEAGSYEYKAALNGSWDDNFGLNAEYYGPNIPLVVEEDGPVTFFYDHKTYWVSDSINSLIANVPGDFQEAIGCPGDWQPDCLRSLLTDPEGDGIYRFTTTRIPAGDYQAKVAVAESWAVNYGADGLPDGPNISFSVPEDAQVTFTWDSDSKVMEITTAEAPAETPLRLQTPTATAASGPPTVRQPDFVTIPGTIQSQLGCPGDWQPNCAETFLVLDELSGIWTNSFDLTAGSYEYKVAIDQSWDENYGLNAERNGPNIPLELAEDQTVSFFYDHRTNWVADSVNHPTAIVIGDFQAAIGCDEDNDATCLLTWLQDPTGAGLYKATAYGIAAGEYTAVIALNQDPDQLVGEPVEFTVPAGVDQIFFEYNPESESLTVNTEGPPPGDLSLARAHWVSQNAIAWEVPADATRFVLHYDAEAGLRIDGDGLGGNEIELTLNPDGLSQAVRQKFPHLSPLDALEIGPDDLRQVRIALKGQVAVAAYGANGRLLDATSLQIPGVLDEVFPYDGPLGVIYEGDVPSLRVWAPTARSVRLHRFADSDPATTSRVQAMRPEPASGTWFIEGDADWTNQYYLYEVEVYVPQTSRIENNLVTDPYAISLSMNSLRSQIVDLRDPALAPDSWDGLVKPELAAFTDISIYELHVRDFSVFDLTVPEEDRGTYMAFTHTESDGMQHLIRLAEAGLTHLHLLPTFDIATIDEDKSTWVDLDFDLLASLPPDSEEQQEIVSNVRAQDGFNWGYDPFHFNAPEGSYSTDPDGPQRIIEFREMVKALNENGLRVVVDVVYNHTNASGQSDKSVLDKVVPGYYHRLDGNGRMTRSTCCENTATEHDMMRKLMVDSVILWATVYKVDGFRFDLMGHHMVDDMIAVREALDGLTMEEHGVDGRSIYVYGEGWDFGEVAGNARGRNATQLDVGGLGIGTFNDRLRDAVRGGNPFGGYLEQGFATGLYTIPNEHENRSESLQRLNLFRFADQTRVGLAGNLADYVLIDGQGNEVRGRDIDYNGSPTGYTLSPEEHIVYVSAHDNETLFDAVQFKAPGEMGLEDRVRMQNLALSIVAMSQGIPFIHAGSDILRSKSFDRDSYDSGDWFNRIDFTLESNNFGIGLPPADKNQAHWEIMRPLLARTDLVPQREHMLANHNHVLEMLQIRYSSPLFRLQTAAQIMERVAFHNTGPDQIPGLIVMSLSDTGHAETLDPDHERIVVLFNGSGETVRFTEAALAGTSFALHPIQQDSADEVVKTAVYDSSDGTFEVPGLTTAVFVAETVAETAPEPIVEEEVEEVEETAEQPDPITEEPDAPETAEPDSADFLNLGGVAAAAALAILVGLGGYVFWQRRES